MADDTKVKNTAYIPIHYPFTVDLNRDQRDIDNSPSGHMRTLTNYVTTHGIIETRSGISLFVQSASAPPSNPENDFTGDANCVALWNFDNDNLDSIGGNNMSGSGTFDAADYKQGTHSLDLELDSSQYIGISDTNLDAGFPGKNGVGEKSWSLTGWFNAESALDALSIFMKWLSGTNDNTYAVMLGTDLKIIVFIGYNAGVSSWSLKFDTAVSVGIWYHLGVTYNASTNVLSIRLRDGSSGSLVAANYTGVCPGNNSPGSSELNIGRNPNSGAHFFDGKLDELVFFDKVLSDANIDSIYAGTYS